jgi:hypothetical protein
VTDDSNRLLLAALGRAFSKCRKDSGQSLEMLSKKCDLPVRLIGSFENGNEDMRVSDIANLLAHIDLNFSDLFHQYELERGASGRVSAN